MISLQTTLLVAAITLLVVMVVAWIGLRDLRHHLVGKPGYRLTNVVFVVVSVIVITQFASVANAALLFYDHVGTVNYRIGLFLATEILQAGVVVWAFLKLDSFAGKP